MKYTFSKNVFCGEYFKNTLNINFQSPVLRQNILCVDIFSENSAPGSCMFILYIYNIYRVATQPGIQGNQGKVREFDYGL